tara:strand:+ start:42 stop:1643 length:1602 start_codon:yes stop_codon:yes gene_type:complete
MVTRYINKDLNGGATGGDGLTPATAYSGAGNGGKDAIDQTIGDFNGPNAVGGEIIFASAGNPIYRCEVQGEGVNQNGTALDPFVWKTDGESTDGKLNKIRVTSMDDANDIDIASGDSYQWNGPNGNGEYYLTIGDSVTVVPVEVKNGVIDGYYMGTSADDDRTSRGQQRGAVGSLEDGQFGWGNTDGLSGNTVYVKFSDNPSNHVIEINRRVDNAFVGFNYHEYEDFEFYGGSPVSVATRTGWKFRRCLSAYPDFRGFQQQTGDAVFISCVGFWAGHSFGNALAGNQNFYQCTDVYAHIFSLNGASSTLTMRNCISAEGEAGGLDNSSGGTIDEDYNLWFPYMEAAGGALSYPSGNINWDKTGDNSIPPQALGTITEQGDLTDPQFSNLQPDTLDLDGLRLLSASPAATTGTDWWTAANEDEPLDYFGNALVGDQITNPPMGAFFTFVSSGSPTLTTPYSIGTNNGPLFTIKTSDTLATIEGAGFFNDNAGYASLLKTGDVVLIEASNGTKLYNVTVDKTSRIITLSTGTEIA